MGRLQDKVAIITGAGQGIGLAYAHRFLAEGAKVVVAEIDQARAEHAMRELSGEGDAIFVRTDVADAASAQRCVEETVKAFGTVHVLVNNAALYYDIDNFDPSYEYLQKVTAVNQHGAWLMAKAAAPVMAAQRYGRIVNQSSGAAYAYTFPAFGDEFTGLGNFSYSITKWGVIGLTKFMAAQLGRWNITVNCIAPGITMTEATKKIVPDFFIQGMTEQTAMKRTLEPDDLAGAAVFFASDDARSCTGQTLVIDGGLAMPA
ncbi:MAG: putative short-chain dehydrogenase/reductase [Acidimicrobiia bacterium]|nr:MAG: putative short-chain dehydrogenase/reductase [Acidimicrobiia bacterium]